MAFCKWLDCKEKSKLWKAGQTILIVTSWAQNICILQNVFSRLFFMVGAWAVSHGLLFWHIERHGCVKIKELKGVWFSKENIFYVACLFEVNLFNITQFISSISKCHIHCTSTLEEIQHPRRAGRHIALITITFRCLSHLQSVPRNILATWLQSLTFSVWPQRSLLHTSSERDIHTKKKQN